ncbi:PP2C family protein-serine/threonine phosphatase [Actinoplanes sp. NPDC051859]|uniref:PP2C family protein-serine/threonine phosphatase n=1 Tax=Actinoplanes sp. NPDC051859 TaxID=3363909 RepID=UPI00379EE73A
MEISTADWTIGKRPVSVAAGSVLGTRYSANYHVAHLDPVRPLAVVADGMGDGPGSTAAGRTAVDVFAAQPDLGSPAALRAAVAAVQKAVRAAGRGQPDLTGCTLTAFVGAESSPESSGDDSAAWLVQLGDSRAYRLRDGLLELLTTDHTAAWLGLLNGWYAADSPQARSARYRLTRYAGHPQAPEPDVINVSLRPGDRYLLCTDGVSDELGDHRLTQLLHHTPALADLLSEASTGADNATAVLLDVR